MGINVEDIGEIDPGTSILLLGSGFSLGSTNLLGQAPPTGPGLRAHFVKQLGLPPDTSYDLQVLADEFGSESESGLYREIYNLFHIADVDDSQLDILAEPWRRIYTTNYDDTVEMAFHKQKNRSQAFTVSDPVPNRIPHGSVVHLHGSVRGLTEENVLDQLVLGEGSYVRQYLTKSPWYNQFQADIKFSTHLFVIGYSLSDYHISALLLENPALIGRTYFIQGPVPDRIFERRTTTYGRPLFIGTDGFAKVLKTLPRAAPAVDFRNLKSFKYLDPLRDKKGLHAPTALEIIDFLVFGTFNYSRCVSTLPSETYVISRSSAVEEFVSSITSAKSFIIDSRLGNGKTIFLYLSFLRLSELGYHCFLFKGAAPDLDRELQTLQTVEKVVIFFDEYTAAQDLLQKIAKDIPKARFVVEIRTSIFEVRYHEVSEKIPRPYFRVTVNKLTAQDVKAFETLCNRAGISTSKLPLDRAGLELRELLLELLDSPNIRAKIDATLGPIFESPAKRRVLLLTMLLRKFQVSADASFIKTVTGVDPYREFRPVKEFSDEVFETESENFRVRSAIFSDYAVRHLLAADEISDCIVEAALAAATRKASRQYRVLMSNLVQFSNIHDALREEVDVTARAVRIYERLRSDERVNDEPLFWLQYAIAMVEAGELLPARQFIESAYAQAALRPGFQTYQIDTQAFRILLLTEREIESGVPVTRLHEILEKLELFDGMLNEDSHRGFAIRVLEDMGPFIDRRGGDLAPPEKVALVFWLSKIIDTLGRLPTDFRVRSGSDFTRSALEVAKQKLI